MAKWYGIIGYKVTTEVEPGIWTDEITEKNYYGETIKNFRRSYQSSGEVNDNINLTNSISIIADPFAVQNFSEIAYIEFMGVKWKVTDVEIQHPRLILSMGGKWNGNEA